MSDSLFTGGSWRAAAWTACELLWASCTWQVAGALSMQSRHLKNYMLAKQGHQQGCTQDVHCKKSPWLTFIKIFFYYFYYNVKNPTSVVLEHFNVGSSLKLFVLYLPMHVYSI